MKFSIAREQLIKPLQSVAGVVERRSTMPVAANLLFVLEDRNLSITGTDLEIEVVARLQLDEAGESGAVTIPARKLVDLCRTLPEDALIQFDLQGERIAIKSGRSRFVLSTLPAQEFPNVEMSEGDTHFECEQAVLKRLMERTAFAMAQQDVRHYLNGMLFELGQGSLRTVATDGHRLALCTREIDFDTGDSVLTAIVPRKGVMELMRLLDGTDRAQVILGRNHIRVITHEVMFTSTLVDSNFPDYQRVLPRQQNNILLVSRQLLRQALSRVAILANEKYRGVSFLVESGSLTLDANNPEQDEAHEQLSVDYMGDRLEVGFNVGYVTDVLGVVESESVRMTLGDGQCSAMIEEPEDVDSVYVIMPMRL